MLVILLTRATERLLIAFVVPDLDDQKGVDS